MIYERGRGFFIYPAHMRDEVDACMCIPYKFFFLISFLGYPNSV